MRKVLLPFFYTILFVIAIITPQYSLIPFVLIVVINVIVLFKTPQNYLWVLFSSIIIGNELIAVINSVICIGFSLIKTKPCFSLQWLKKPKPIICIVLLLVSLVFAIVYSAIWNFVFSALYLSLVVIAYKFINVDTSAEKFLLTIKSAIVLEFICTIIIALNQRNLISGDAFKGTFSDAHDLGNWLILTTIFFVVVNVCYLKTSILQMIKKEIVYFIMLLIMLYLCSAKALYVAAVLGAALYFIMNKNKLIRKNNLFWFFLLTYLLMAIILKIIYLEPVEVLISEKSDYLRLYLYDSAWNYKFSYFKGTLFDELTGVHFFFGYGLGQYGSRFANLFAYETMWRADNIVNNLIPVFFPAKCLPEYAQYIEFYTQQFVDEIAYRSAIISYPFSSFIAFIAEIGVVGFLLISFLLNKIFKENKGRILIFYFFIACIFDIFFDNFQCLFPVIMYIRFCDVLEKNNTISDETVVKL